MLQAQQTIKALGFTLHFSELNSYVNQHWINHFSSRVDYSRFLSFTKYSIKHDMDCIGNFAVKSW